MISRSTFNEPLPHDLLAQLEPNQTTASEAAELMGAPAEVIQLGHRSAWRYEYTVSKDAMLTVILVTLRNTDSHSDRAWLFFDEDDVLTHFASTLGSDRAEYILPWSKLDH